MNARYYMPDIGRLGDKSRLWPGYAGVRARGTRRVTTGIRMTTLTRREVKRAQTS